METFKGVLTLLAIAALVVFAPFAWVWSINALFALHVPYTLATWAAALFVNLQLGGALILSRYK